ncbi:DUF5018 domain-containing protein [Flagellimonas sp. S174]|uniref:DUF5018 domain-containing protein n=1 Tax=Flagellimonas sp. S174 TaxID=3410790 RepID=UPI003BF545C5
MKIDIYLTIAVSILLVASCSTDTSNEQQEERSSGKRILEFSVLGLSGMINQEDNIISLVVPDDSDLTTLAPTLSISENASVSPASGTSQDFTTSVEYIVSAEDGTTQNYLVTINTLTYSFTVGSKSYELIRDELNWNEATEFATSRGGSLAEVNDLSENQGILTTILNNGNIVFPNLARELIWLGGNDLENEGIWILDGNNDGQGPQFWEGANNGMSVNGLFNNWGSIEPDGGDL